MSRTLPPACYYSWQPTREELAASPLDLIYAGTEHRTLMIEVHPRRRDTPLMLLSFPRRRRCCLRAPRCRFLYTSHALTRPTPPLPMPSPPTPTLLTPMLLTLPMPPLPTPMLLTPLPPTPPTPPPHTLPLPWHPPRCHTRPCRFGPRLSPQVAAKEMPNYVLKGALRFAQKQLPPIISAQVRTRAGRLGWGGGGADHILFYCLVFTFSPFSFFSPFYFSAAAPSRRTAVGNPFAT